jgi:hypothetical protein
MILAVTYKEQFSRVAPAYSRAHWPEHTDEMEVNWVTQADGWLVYEWDDESVICSDNMNVVKSYTTRSK